METVEVLIRIPEVWIEAFKAFKYPSALHVRVLQGTVLPKGHGRLIDADAFIEKLKDVRKEVWLIWLTTDELMQEIIETLETSGSAESDAPTVLEKEARDDEV